MVDNGGVHLNYCLAMFTDHLKAAGRSPGTVRLRRVQIGRFIDEISENRAADVTVETIERWMGRQEWTPTTRHSNRTALRTFFAFCERRGYIERSPATDLPAVTLTRPMPRPVDDLSYRRALRDARPREALMVRLAAEAGLRRAEVAAVHSRDLFQDLGGWSLVVHGKGGRVRYVPLKPDLAVELRALPHGWAFPAPDGGHLTPAHVGVLVRRLLPEGYSMHKLRTRFGTRAYAVDHDILAVQDLMGHASPTTTQVYIALPADAKRALVEAI